MRRLLCSDSLPPTRSSCLHHLPWTYRSTPFPPLAHSVRAPTDLCSPVASRDPTFSLHRLTSTECPLCAGRGSRVMGRSRNHTASRSHGISISWGSQEWGTQKGRRGQKRMGGSPHRGTCQERSGQVGQEVLRLPELEPFRQGEEQVQRPWGRPISVKSIGMYTRAPGGCEAPLLGLEGMRTL